MAGGSCGCGGATGAKAHAQIAAPKRRHETEQSVVNVTRRSGNSSTDDAAGGADLLSQLEKYVSKSAIGTQVFDELKRNGAKIQVMSDADFQRRYPGAGGIYDPNTDRIYVPQKALRNGQNLALTMVHEGTHWLQDHIGNTKLATVGGALGNAISSNHAYGQSGSSKNRDWQDEAQAYVVESLAAHELGVRDFGLGTDKSGNTRSFDQTMQVVASNPLYRNGG